MTFEEYSKLIVKATNEFCSGMPYRLGAPIRIQFALERIGELPPVFTNTLVQIAIGCAEDLNERRLDRALPTARVSNLRVHDGCGRAHRQR